MYKREFVHAPKTLDEANWDSWRRDFGAGWDAGEEFVLGKSGSRTCQWAPPFREEVQAGCDADDQYATAQEQAPGINSPSEKMNESFESETKNGAGK